MEKRQHFRRNAAQPLKIIQTQFGTDLMQNIRTLKFVILCCCIPKRSAIIHKTKSYFQNDLKFCFAAGINAILKFVCLNWLTHAHFIRQIFTSSAVVR